MRFNEDKFNETAFNGVGTYIGEKYEMLHWEDVKTAYKNEQERVVVLLLSAFFESAITSYLKESYDKKIEEHGESSEHLGSGFIEDNNFSFAHKLQIARVNRDISEEEYGVINKIRDARNDLAHTHKSWSPGELGIQANEIDKAIKIYEKWLDIQGEKIV